MMKCAFAALVASLIELATVFTVGTMLAIRDDYVPMVYVWLTVGGCVTLVGSICALGWSAFYD